MTGAVSKPASPPADRPDAAPRHRLLLVTGMSGAGRSTALKALEDMGYEAVDNLPLSLLGSLLRSPAALPRSLAIGVDIRTRDFGVSALLGEVERLEAAADLDFTLLFLDCDDENLRRRYTETRRRHPLAGDRQVADGIRHERELLARLRERADVVVDTTGFAPADIRRFLEDRFAPAVGPDMAVFVVSFSYRNGLPRAADLVFDARFLRNPHYEPELRPLTGRAPAVAAFIEADPDFDRYIAGLTDMLTTLLPRFADEGKRYLTIAVGCTGGRHRSVFVAERLGAWIEAGGHRVRVSHRDADGGGQM
ncbi:MAG: RNase adapter RapZ [Alphaproteobacteria bacterium]